METYMIEYRTNRFVVVCYYDAENKTCEVTVYNKEEEEWITVGNYIEDRKDWHFDTDFSQFRSMLGLIRYNMM